MIKIIFLFVGLLFNGCDKDPVIVKPDDTPDTTEHTFRVTGYFYGDLINDVSKVEFEKLTDINIAFINPDYLGKFKQKNGLAEFVQAAHQHQVKVLISIGGGSAPTYLKDLIKPAFRGVFISNIKHLIDSLQIDGVDIDLEGEMITNNYESFMLALKDSIKPKKMLTAAIATYQAAKFTGPIIAALDYITIMAYDKTGPWNPSNPGPHSTYEHAVNDLDIWLKKVNSKKEKLNLGVPFYGYGFNGSIVLDWKYSRIIRNYPGAENFDEISMNGGGTMYYNGIPTMKRKTSLAMDKAGGVSIWHILADTIGNKSLLNAIQEEIIKTK